MNAKGIGELLTETYTQWSESKPFQLAAALAYYMLFSLSPLLIIVIAVAGLVFGREAAQNQIVATIQGLVGTQSAQAIQEMIQSASTPSSGILATIVGVVLLVIGAGGVVGQLQESLNTMWGVESKAGSGILGLLRARFISFAMVLGLGFLLLVSLVVSAGLSAAVQLLSGLLPGGTVIWQGVELLISFGFITLLFALIYKGLPAVRIAWRDVWIGAAITALLFTVGKFLLGLYLGQSAVTSSYGAAGALVVILLWVYYSSLIFFFGAEFTKVYASTYGSGVVPTEDARPLPEEARTQTKGAPVRAQAKTPGVEGASRSPRKAAH